MRLAKEIEFPIFHLGTIPDSKGKPVTFTPELLREMERNSNFVHRAGILQAPVRYDHPAFGAADKENHGKMVRYEVRNNSLFAVGTNWSERLQQDKAREARIAYSPEFVSEFSYPDPETGKMITLGPTVVGLALLGGDRPAIKNLKPLAKFEFGENVGPADAFLLREELRSAGMLGEYVDEAHYFGEVENDARRFFEETKEQPMTAEDRAEMQRMLDAQSEKHKTEMAALETKTEEKIKSFSEESKEKKARMDFCEARIEDKPLGKSGAIALRAFAENPTWDNAKTLIMALPAAIIPKDKAKEGDGGDKGDEPEALAKLTPKMFSDISGNDAALNAGWHAFAEHDPKKAAPLKGKPVTERYAALKQYVIERDAEAN